MINLLKSLSLMVAVVFISSSAAYAGFAASANPTSVGPINVKLVDGAKDACWTNLREAREYAEEKLKIKGYDVVAKYAGEYEFRINVNAFQDNRGVCVGNIEVSIEAPITHDGIFGYHVIGIKSTIVTNSNNLNKLVIGRISGMIDEM